MLHCIKRDNGPARRVDLIFVRVAESVARTQALVVARVAERIGSIQSCRRRVLCELVLIEVFIVGSISFLQLRDDFLFSISLRVLRLFI